MHGYLTYRRKAKERNLPIMNEDDWILFWKRALKSYDMTKARKAYNHQMMMANKRRITWLFNIEEWLKWWEANLGSNWMKKRGCKHGQYVMARNGDSGPYSTSNIKCILAVDNSKEGARVVGNAHHMRRHLPPRFDI